MLDPVVLKVTQQVAGPQLVKVHDAEGSLQDNNVSKTCTF